MLLLLAPTQSGMNTKPGTLTRVPGFVFSKGLLYNYDYVIRLLEEENGIIINYLLIISQLAC